MRSKAFMAVAIASLLVATLAAVPAPRETSARQIEDGGTGAYKAISVIDSTLPTHTIFRPKDLAPFGEKVKLPILAWGNGACANTPQEHQNFLSEIASHGYLVVAIGPLQAAGARGGGGRGAGTRTSQLTEAIDWAIAQNGNQESPYFGKIDTAKVAVAGMSCGGLQALEVSPDPRVTTTIICNSGIIGDAGATPARGPAPATGAASAPAAPVGGAPAAGPGRAGRGGGIGGMPALTKDHLTKLHAPILYILGGTTDIAYENGMDDYRRIEKLPAFVANMDVGHGGTYGRPHGGEFSPVAIAWLNWQLKGDKESAKMFAGQPAELSKNPIWKAEKKNIP